MSRRMIPVSRSIDNVRGFHIPLPLCKGRDRTIVIRFRPQDGGYEVHAWGEPFPETGNRTHIGHLTADSRTIESWIADLHCTWNRKAICWQDPDDHDPAAAHRYPFADEVDLRKAAAPGQLEQMWRELARAGHRLFWSLFNMGDDRLRAIGTRLVEALWEGEQVIKVMSDDVVAPWSMLYVPRDPEARLEGTFEVNPSAFLGYRHLVEHAFEIEYEPAPDIRFRDSLGAGAYYDSALDGPGHPRRPRHPLVRPVLRVLERHAAVRRGTSRAEVAEHLRGDGSHDQIIYFCCHCVRGQAGQPVLRLSDRDDIAPNDFEYWLGKTGLRAGNPLLVVNACQAGNLAGHAPSHFSKVLLTAGASCLLGPTVNIPAVFASAFAQNLFVSVLAGKRPFGEALQALTRQYVREAHNPFGLSYMLYQGIDGHFCQREVPDVAAPAEGPDVRRV
jgi:hypothetical protein